MNKGRKRQIKKHTQAVRKSPYEPPKATLVARKKVERLDTCASSETQCNTTWHH